MEPNREEYEDALQMLQDYAKRLDDDILEEVKSTQEDEAEDSQLIGYRFSRGNHVYVIHGRRDDKAEYFNVTFPYNFLLDFSRVLMLKNTDKDPEELQGKEIDVKAGISELQSFAKDDPQRYDAMRARLIDLLSSPNTSYAIGKQNGVITSIESTSRVFPYQEDFSIVDLQDAIQSVIGVGIPARNHLQRAHRIAPRTHIPEATKPKEDVEEPDAKEGGSDSLHYIN